MAITEECGPHCGIASGREAHCGGAECHDGTAPVIITRADLTAGLAGIPMCARWYDGVQVMPWIAYLDGCLCAVSAQALPRQHGPHCPVWQYWEREHAPGQDPAEAAGIIAATGA